MRLLKIVGALAAILAFTAIASGTAFAEVEFLPGAKGTTFTGVSKEAKLKSAAGTIVCTKSTVTKGELLSSTEALIVIKFENCTIAGLEARGLEDAEKSKNITTHVEAKSCTVSTSPLVGAVLLKPLPVHIEVPAAKLLLLVEGTVIGLLTPVNTKGTTTFNLLLNEKEGKQEDRTCKDKVTGAALTENLIVKDDGKETGEGVEIVKEGTLTFTVGQEFMT